MLYIFIQRRKTSSQILGSFIECYNVFSYISACIYYLYSINIYHAYHRINPRSLHDSTPIHFIWFTINDEMDAGQRKLYFEGGSRHLIFVYFWLVPYGTMLQMVFHHIKCFEITTVIVYLCWCCCKIYFYCGL